MTQENTLRTLKDINFISCTKYFGGSSWECLDKEVQEAIKKDLRTEAIKWIKQINAEIQKIRSSPHALDRPDLKIEIWKKFGMIDWIKHFFNMVDDELK